MQRTLQYSKTDLTFSNLCASELNELCDHLCESTSEKSLSLSHLQWDVPDISSTKYSAAAVVLSKMIAQNYSLKKIELSDKLKEDDETLLITALKRNLDITQFNMQCSDESQAIVNIIIERNKQFRIAQRILINELLRNFINAEPALHDMLEELRTINESNATADEVSLILFQTKMRAHFSESLHSANIQQTIDLIKKLKMAGIKQGISALQASAALNHMEYAYALIKSGCDPDTESFRGESALEMAVIEGHMGMVKLLCENGASKTKRSSNGKTPFETALESRNDAIAAYLDPSASAKDKKKHLAKRNLVVGFGVNIFNEMHQERHIRSFNAGGSKREGMAILTEYLRKFADHHNHPKLQLIANQFQSSYEALDLTPDAMALKLNSAGVLHNMTGCLSHLTGLAIHKLDEQTYQLTLSDRGLLMHRAPKNLFNDKKPALQSLTFSAAVLTDILQMIVAARNEVQEVAENMLFHDIPRIAKSEWKYHANSLHAAIKSGTCFFSNFKPLVQDEFYHFFGDRYGKKLYKEFTLFLRAELLRDYEQFAETDDEYAFLAENKVLETRAKFITDYT